MVVQISVGLLEMCRNAKLFILATTQTPFNSVRTGLWFYNKMYFGNIPLLVMYNILLFLVRHSASLNMKETLFSVTKTLDRHTYL